MRPQAGTWRPRVPQYVPSNPIRNAAAGFPTSGGARPRVTVPVPRNPIKEGKQMLCDLCGAFTHLQSRCPHNPHRKVYVSENWEEMYNTDDYSDENEYFMSANDTYVKTENNYEDKLEHIVQLPLRTNNIKVNSQHYKNKN